MSRIEGGALKPEKEWYPVDELIHDVLGHMQPLLQDRVVLTDPAQGFAAGRTGLSADGPGIDQSD